MALDHNRIAQALAQAPIGHAIEYHAMLASTNDRATELARAGSPHGTVVFADSQSAGRGRRGRSWQSPPGLNLYLSVLLRPADLPVAHWPRLTTTVALALCRAFEDQVPGLQAQVKWPNDIYLRGRKVAGILIETGQVGSSEDSRYVVIGTGINVLAQEADFPPELREIATSLALAADHSGAVPLPGAAVTREAVASDYLRHLADLYAATLTDFDATLAEVAARSLLLGHAVRWLATDGEHTGHALGLDPLGQLRVRLGDGSEQTLGSVEQIRLID
jgi:BirA family biotin operon repressor/biotin-[acetyl-CoA-carboxylase] ligase